MTRLGTTAAELSTLEFHGDERGSLVEIWRRSTTTIQPAQLTVTRSKSGVLRGMHVHRNQTDVWYLVDGRAFVAVVDIRARPYVAYTAELDRSAVLVIPPWIAHGAYIRESATLVYLVDHEYDGADEFGFQWDDPDVGIPWPTTQVTLSDRDRKAPSLAELVRALG